MTSAPQADLLFDNGPAFVPSSGITGGALDVTTGSMSQAAFDALNAALNAGGFFGARGFDIKTGDLVIGADPVTGQTELQAQSVTVSVDAGSLTGAAEKFDSSRRMIFPLRVFGKPFTN